MSIALDDLALKRARLRAAMQPRNDQTINELPVLGLPVSSDIIPAWRSGQTFQTTAGLIASLGVPSSTTSLEWYNVKSFGALGNGSHDDTSSIQAAINACVLAGGGIVYLPAGTYLLSAALTIAGLNPLGAVSVSILGSGSIATTLLQSNLSASIFSGFPYPSGYEITGCYFRDFGVNYTGTPTGGSVFAFPWYDTSVVCGIFVQQCFNFFTVGHVGTTSTINEVWFHDIRCSTVYGTALNFFGSGGNVYVTDSYFQGSGTGGTSTALVWNNSYYDVLWLRGLDFEQFGAGFNFSANAATTGGLTDAFIEDIIIDGPGSYAISMSAGSATSSFTRIKFRNVWTTSPGPCLSLGVGTGGTIRDVTFFGCNFQGISAGIILNGAVGLTLSDIAFDFCQVYASPSAIALSYTQNISVMNCSIGTPYGGGVGTVLSPTNTNTGLLFQGNRIANYTPFLGGSGLASIGAGSLIANNLGVDPYGALSAPPYVAASPATNTFPFNVRVSVTSATAVAINGTATGGAAGAYVLLPGETITPTGAGSWTWAGL